MSRNLFQNKSTRIFSACLLTWALFTVALKIIDLLKDYDFKGKGYFLGLLIIVSFFFRSNILRLLEELKLWARENRSVGSMILAGGISAIVPLLQIYPPELHFIFYACSACFLFFVIEEMLLKSTAPVYKCVLPADAYNLNHIINKLEKLLVGNCPPKRIGILGPWGSGKTFIVDNLMANVEGVCLVAKVNLWNALTPQDAWHKISDAIDQALHPGTDFTPYLKRRWLHLIQPFLPHWASNSAVEFYRYLTESGVGKIQALNRIQARIDLKLSACRETRLVIFIDDMERAEPKVIRKIFPAIDDFIVLNNCSVVIAVDYNHLRKAFSGEGSVDDSQGFLDRVLDFRFELPEPSQRDVVDNLKSMVDPYEYPRLSSALEELETLLPQNPRKLERFYLKAITLEKMFISDYSLNEKLWPQFFLFHLIDCEFDGFSKIMQKYDSELSRNHFGSLTERSGLQEVLADEHFGKMSDRLLGDLNVFAENRKERFKYLMAELTLGYQNVFTEFDNSVEWMGNGVYKILELFGAYQAVALKKWDSGSQGSAQYLLSSMELPNPPNQNLANSFFDILYRRIVENLPRAHDDKDIRLFVLNEIEKLHCHIENFHHEKFENMYFGQIFLSKVLDDALRWGNHLRDERNTELLQAWLAVIELTASKLPPEQAVQSFVGDINLKIQNLDYDYLSNLREWLIQTDEILKNNRNNALVDYLLGAPNLSDSYENNIAGKAFDQLCFKPESWLPVGSDLRQKVRVYFDSNNVSEQSGSRLIELLDFVLKYLKVADGGPYDHNKRTKVLELFTDDPEYLTVLWDGCKQLQNCDQKFADLNYCMKRLIDTHAVDEIPFMDVFPNIIID